MTEKYYVHDMTDSVLLVLWKILQMPAILHAINTLLIYTLYIQSDELILLYMQKLLEYSKPLLAIDEKGNRTKGQWKTNGSVARRLLATSTLFVY